VRKIFFGGSWDLKDKPAGLDAPLGEVLLRPTRIYVKPIQAILRAYRTKKVIHGMAHITGSGLPGNVPRVLPSNVDAVIHLNRWERPPIFDLIQQAGKVSDAEMMRVFNMGIGMVLIVSRYYRDSILAQLAESGVPARAIGEIVRGSGGVVFKNRARGR
jgi:phosphoribosylformylglycinamidine cyclo-ligase